jgi:NADPH:quinone reductase-like Zn-dependent oxidoreductase
MRAMHAFAPGDATQLVVEDAPRPTIQPGDVLLRVHASGVTPSELSWPTTWLNADDSPRTPPIVPGHEVSGVVEEVGSDAEGHEVGDAVYGLIAFRRDGGNAEYVAVRAAELVTKPGTLTHVQTAAVPLSALTAWQALFDHGGLREGQRVLIHGGAGGVGSFAIQLARWRDAHVATTVSGRDADLVRKLGADEVIDYREQRFEDVAAGQDVIFDTVGGETWERSWQALRPGGRLVSVAVPRPPDRMSEDGKQAIWFVVQSSQSQLREIGGLIDAGAVRPIVAATLSLEQGREVYGHSKNGRSPGKVVLLVHDA